MRKKLLVSLVALTSTFALVSCEDDSATAQSIWDVLTPIYEEYKNAAVHDATELFHSVADFQDIAISYALATDKAQDEDGNIFATDQDFVTVEEKDDQIFLTVTESEKYIEPVYIDLRATINLNDQDYNHDFTIQAEPLRKTLQGSVGEVKDQFLALHPTIDSKVEQAIVTGTVVSFDWSGDYNNGYSYIADADGRGMYAFRIKAGADIDGASIVIGDQVTIAGDLEAGHGLQISNGQITAVETGAGAKVNPIVLDENNWDTIGASYINAGDWLTIQEASIVDDVPEITTKNDVPINITIGDKALLWYVNKYTNAGDACYEPINSLQLKAGDKIALTVPLGFHGSVAQLSWSLNATIAKVE